MGQRTNLLLGEYKKTDTIFTSCSNSWTNVVPGEGHTVIMQGNPAIISKQSYTVIKAVTHIPVGRNSEVFKDNLWWHWWNRVHLNTVTTEVFWSEKVSWQLSKYLVDPFSFSNAWVLKWLLNAHRIWFLKMKHMLIFTQLVVFDQLNAAINGGLW